MDDLDKSSSTEIPKHVQQSIDELEASAIAWLQFKEQLQGFTWQKGPHFDSGESDVRIKSWLDILDLAEVAGALILLFSSCCALWQ
ncbi:MAG: hypothetical protein OXF06_09235 [Bacteroidetes bacterium]|nr:hypothetical protein [Bacteroidota bacterium]